MGAYARKYPRYDKSPERKTNGALSVLWYLWELHRVGEIFRICPTGTVEEQAKKRPILLADMEEVQGYIKDTSSGNSPNICNKCLLGEWLIEEPIALIGHDGFCEGL